jgi:hypothetical protein
MQGTSFTKFQRWTALSLLNFCLVAILGVILRYKIAFSLPMINYNFILEAHSHFAFSGWISTAVFTALVYILSKSGYPVGKIYIFQFRLAQTASLGMLLSFSFEGYGFLSMFFSMVFILFSWWFALQYWKDVSRSDLPSAIKRWAKAALFFFVLSSMGILILAYLKYHKIDSPELYFNALYLFIHFQYNGWFSFGVLTLFFFTARSMKLDVDENRQISTFMLMLTACIPAYCLSLLWMSPPAWVFAIAAVAALLQLGALVLFFMLLRRSWVHWARLQFQIKLLWGFSFIAFMIKLLLQAFSVVPRFGRLAFGFRPVIIAYLHLVMLGFISFFMVGFFIKEKLVYADSGMWHKGLFIFITGVVLTEVLLLIQALSAINNVIQSSLPILLFAAATILVAGIFLMLVSQLKLNNNNRDQLPLSH